MVKSSSAVSNTEYLRGQILELAEKVIEMTGSKSKTIFKDLPVDDPMQRKPDNSLAKENLCWEPKIQLEEGLKKTITYFKELDSNST